jgi:hypothetical protein
MIDCDNKPIKHLADAKLCPNALPDVAGFDVFGRKESWRCPGYGIHDIRTIKWGDTC